MNTKDIIKRFEESVSSDISVEDFPERLKDIFRKHLPNAWVNCKVRKGQFSDEGKSDIYIDFGLIGDGNLNMDSSVIKTTRHNDPMHRGVIFFGNLNGQYKSLDPVRFIVNVKPEEGSYLAFANKKLAPPISKKAYTVDQLLAIFDKKIKIVSKALKDEHDSVSFGSYQYDKKHF